MTDNADSEDQLVAMQAMFGAAFPQLAELFRADCIQKMKVLQNAIETGNRKEITEVAHSLSGSCSSIGAARMGTLVKNLERQSRTDSAADMLLHLQEVESAYRRTDARLREMLAQEMD